MIIQDPRVRMIDEMLRFLITLFFMIVCRDEIFHNEVCLIKKRKYD